MNDYAKTLLKKELEQKCNTIEDCEWWIRSINSLLQDEKQLENKSEDYVEAYEQRLRSFQEAKERLEEEVTSLRAAIRALRI